MTSAKLRQALNLMRDLMKKYPNELTSSFSAASGRNWCAIRPCKTEFAEIFSSISSASYRPEKQLGSRPSNFAYLKQVGDGSRACVSCGRARGFLGITGEGVAI